MRTLARDCPLCGCDDATIVPLGPEQWPMGQCRRCAMVYLTRAPDVSELYENISWEKSAAIEEQRRQREFGWLRRLSRLTRRRLHLVPRKQARALIERHAPPGKVLDIGCGPGVHVLALPPRYTPYGIEISVKLAEQGRERFRARGGDVITADALGGLAAFEDASFTGIVMRSFLEHDVRPLRVLEECRRVLREGGIAVIKVPNYGSVNRRLRGARWCGLRFPDHVNYFTPRSLADMVARAGLGIERFGFLDRLPTSDNMWLIASRREPANGR